MLRLFILAFLSSCTFLAEHPEVVKEAEEITEEVVEDVAKYELYRNNPEIERAVKFESHLQ